MEAATGRGPRSRVEREGYHGSRLCENHLAMVGWEGRRKLPPRQSSFRTVALLIITPIIGLLGILLWMFLLRFTGIPAPVPAGKQRRVAAAAVVAPPRKVER